MYQHPEGMPGIENRSPDRFLNRDLLPFEKVVAAWGIFYARATAHLLASAMESEDAAAANARYVKIFPRHLLALTKAAVTDPKGFRRKIRTYESSINAPRIPGFAAREVYEQLVENDPLRNREKTFLLEAMFSNELIENDLFHVVDLGSGGGRLLLALEKALREMTGKQHQAVGVDIDIENCIYARNRTGERQAVMFAAGDISAAPIAADSASLCCMNSVIQLIPFYKRPLMLLEMVRILKPNGEGVITGPNEKCSLAAYIRSVFASQPVVYLNPVISLRAMELAPFTVKFDEMCRQRADYSYLDTHETCLVLEYLGCRILRVETWPGFYPDEDIFTGIWFKKKP
jgi:ubiquinone/menaquinone biosynthesis C-methylase UbiE